MRRREFIAMSGAVAASSIIRLRTAQAQQHLPLIGWLSAAKASAVEQTTAAFRQGLSELGYVEGRNVEILYLWAESRNELLGTSKNSSAREFV
jgi:putative ABC transport system substrate-binding protein